MQPHEIKCAIVGRMQRDGIYVSRQVANIDRVVQLALPAEARSDGKREITDYMIPDRDCPVVLVSQGVIALEPDPDKVRLYLLRYCESQSELPPGMREDF